ncbi:unnamed protein product [Coregonus sp. 'balchen']|nr:unnamed protein product [Coregonus sp. 'balchen']
MIPQSSREFIVKISGYWKPLFKGRFLLVTNTMSCGGMLAPATSFSKPERNRGSLKRHVTGLVQDAQWYQWLDKFFLGNALPAVSKKVLTDQLIASPTMAAWYFIGMGKMEGHSLSEGLEDFWDSESSMSTSSPWGETPTSPTSNTVSAALAPFCYVANESSDNVEGSTGDITELNEQEQGESGSATKQLEEKL